MTNHELSYQIENAQDRVFCWMQVQEYDRKSGSKELDDFPDWQEAWENWWDEGED